MADRIETRAAIARKKRIIGIIGLGVVMFFAWASLFKLDEVAIGSGRVVPSTETQLVQSQIGGRVLKLLVQKSDIVAAGQLLAVLDDSQARAELENTETEYQTARAQKVLLETLIAGGDSLAFDPAMGIPADITAQKLGLFQDTLRAYRGTLDNLQNEFSLYQKEIDLLDKAAAGGGGTPIERLRLQQKMASLQTQIDTHSQDFLRDNSMKLDEVSANLARLEIRRQAQTNLLAQTQITAPGRGIVQDIAVSTAGGGVIPPNGTLLELIPLDDRLLVETQYSPRDIAFISEDQSARIKISAFDESIYGALTAKVLKVSPDSVKDERTGEYHFSVLLQADKTFFSSKDGKTYNITPGMTATSEILTGSRSVMQYILKPIRKASEAFRER